MHYLFLIGHSFTNQSQTGTPERGETFDGRKGEGENPAREG